MTFPNERMQRYRQRPEIRQLFQETTLRSDNLIMPIFINEALTSKQAITSLPGLFQWSVNDVMDEIGSCRSSGIKHVILFGIPKVKDVHGSEADNPEGVVQKCIRAIKSTFPEMVIMADCCLCEYTDHGHCGVFKQEKMDNDKTLERLASVALSYAKAGADVIAPSGMMDGVILTLRQALDRDGYGSVLLMSYASKFASSLYGPFREAAGSSDGFVGDRNHHQLAPAQRREAIREALLDNDEGADILMVKPAHFYQDILRDIREKTNLPLAVYQVSGEYAMFKAAAEKGIANETELVDESLLSLKRAGADMIISYFSKEVAQRMKND